jgi:S-DNA-T family DNA segregation ATPase FtsK/SpoIIIE
MRSDYEVNNRSVPSRGTNSRRLPEIEPTEELAFDSDFDDAYFAVPEQPVERQAPKRQQRQMPKRLSEELAEPAPVPTPTESKPKRSRKYQKDQTVEQIPLELKTPAKKPDTSVKQRHILGISFIVFAILLIIAIVTYSPLDAPQAETRLADLPAIFTRSDPVINARADTVHNSFGLLGAMLADFFINSTVGYAALVFPMLMLGWSVAFFRSTVKQRRKLMVATSFLLISAVLLSATIGTMQLMALFGDIPREWSGAVGQFLGQSFTRLIGSIGSFIFFGASFLVMLIFSVDLDVERTFMRGKTMWDNIVGWTRLKLVEFWDKREAKRLAKADRHSNEITEEEIEETEDVVVNIPPPEQKKKKPLRTEPIERDVEAEVTVPLRSEPVIAIKREQPSEEQQEKKEPYLKIRPAPKTIERPAAIPRITNKENDTLGKKTSERLVQLSAGALSSNGTQRSVRLLPDDLINDTNSNVEEVKPVTITAAPEPPAPPAPEPANDAEIIIGDEKVLSNDVLPHSAETIADQPVIKAAPEPERIAPPTLFADAYTPENPYNESLKNYHTPSFDLLTRDEEEETSDADNEELTAKGRLLRDKLATFGVEIENITVTPGPVVTLYEFTPAEGVKVSAVGNLTDDIALAMKARGIRIIAPMPGRGTIGIEIPNDNPKMVRMRSMLESNVFSSSKMNLPIALGKTISGDVYVDDLSKMPHLLIAGATGSGKSVGVNGIIASLLYAKNPRDVKFVIVDPKKIELSLYRALANHFLIVSPEAGEEIVTTPSFAVLALKALEVEMERRYDKLAKAAVRSLADYNTKVAHGKLQSTAKEQHYHLPYIVVIIDELADLMITAGKDIEEPICRLAQMARAVGIHLILATQRPSVDVITGVIKANFPARIAYQVATKVDSRTILDTMGAEQLLGNGDMLYLPSGTPKPIRLQAPFISTEEVEAIVEAIAEQQGIGSSYSRPWTLPTIKEKGGTDDFDGDRDELFDEAAYTVFRHQQASTSMLQRRLKIGYSRAARIMDELESAGIISSGDGAKAREVLVSSEADLELLIRN